MKVMDKEESAEAMKPENLEFGVIYVFTELFTPQSLLDDYIAAMSRACNQAEALSRFSTKVVYVDTPPTLVARRFNAGNVGHAAVLTCPVCGDITIDGRLVAEFIRRLFDFSDLDGGDNQIKVGDFLSDDEKRRMTEAIDNPDLFAKMINAQSHASGEREVAVAIDSADKEECELAEAERRRGEFLEVIGKMVTNYVSLTHNDPRDLLGDSLASSAPLIFSPRQLSRLVIDRDLRVWLSDYGNAEIRLHPLSKSLYILFLLHPEGIELRNIDEHRRELESIYDIVMPGRDLDAGESIIENVLNPLTGTLVQNLSRIKRFFKTVIMDDTVASQYYIAGRRNGAYRIALPRHLVTMPRAFGDNG